MIDLDGGLSTQASAEFRVCPPQNTVPPNVGLPVNLGGSETNTGTTQLHPPCNISLVKRRSNQQVDWSLVLFVLTKGAMGFPPRRVLRRQEQSVVDQRRAVRRRGIRPGLLCDDPELPFSFTQKTRRHGRQPTSKAGRINARLGWKNDRRSFHG